MRIWKSHPIFTLVNNYLVDSPQPSNLSYLWNFGSLLGFCLIIQIITGVTLAMHYNPSVLEAFNSVEHIMRDVNNGWLIRYLHSNTASAFFFLVYLHIGRGLYYGSYKAPRTLVWTIGTVIFILMMATAFLGYITSPTWLTWNLNSNQSIDLIIYCPLRGVITNKPIFNVWTQRYYISSSNSNLLSKFWIENKLNPVHIYNNLHLKETKEIILKSLKTLSGVYLIFNNTTGDYYIGSASTGKFYSRFYRHLISLTGNKILKHAVRKYGIDNFSFIILELFPEVVNKENNKKLLDIEDFYLKFLLPNYNILTEAGSNFGYKHTELSRIKIKTNYSDFRRELIGNLNKGKTFSQNTLNKMREKALKRVKPIFSDKALANMRKKSKAITLYNLDKTVFGQYSSIVEASRDINCNEKTIIRALKTEKKILKRRFIVKYKSN